MKLKISAIITTFILTALTFPASGFEPGENDSGSAQKKFDLVVAKDGSGQFSTI